MEVLKIVLYLADSKSFKTHMASYIKLIHKRALHTQMISVARLRLMTNFTSMFRDIDILTDMLDELTWRKSYIRLVCCL